MQSMISSKTVQNYYPYVCQEWKFKYFLYDELKAEYDALRNNIHDQDACAKLCKFDRKYRSEILRVSKFIESKAKCYTEEMDHVAECWKEDDEQTVERTLRVTFDRVHKLKHFYDLNRYLICKIAKKMEKLLAVVNTEDKEIVNYLHKYDHPSEGVQLPLVGLDTVKWIKFPSCYAFTNVFFPYGKLVEDQIPDRCISIYSTIFRQKHPALAFGDLKYVKSRDQDSKHDRFMLGLKTGLTVAIFLQLILDACVLKEFNFPIWKSYGLYVYSTFGNILLFKTTWVISVSTWLKHDINYISLFKMQNLQPKTILILNETMNRWLLWVISLGIFFQANSRNSLFENFTLSWICPLSLVLLSILFYLTRLVYPEAVDRSRGLFTGEVWIKCFKTPLVPVTFRENYAADVLTSFTKVIGDGIYSFIWIITGSFLTTDDNIDAGNELPMSKHAIETIVNIVVIYVLWIRTSQCLRQIYDTGQSYPHIYNAGKYASSIVVVLYGMFRSVDGWYIFLIVFASLYKWWWDVVMDWGLSALVIPFNAENNRFKHPFLREKLIYRHAYKYYIMMFVDLILRFVWVLSLVPTSTLVAAFGPLFSIYLGSLEILRRFLWGLFRVEWEHVKWASKKKVGYRIDSVGDSRFNRGMLYKLLSAEDGNIDEDALLA